MNAENESNIRAGYTNSGSPANLSVSRTVRLAMVRRVTLGRPRPEIIARLEAEVEERNTCINGLVAAAQDANRDLNS